MHDMTRLPFICTGLPFLPKPNNQEIRPNWHENLSGRIVAICIKRMKISGLSRLSRFPPYDKTP